MQVMNEILDIWKDFSANCESLGLELTELQIEKISLFHSLLMEKNKALNLTRIENLDEAILKHYLDTVFLILAVKQRSSLASIRSILDLGSGGGVPGVILGILLPDITELTLVEARNKKLEFLKFACSELGLPLRAIHDHWTPARAKQWVKNNSKADLVTARAVSEPLNLVRILSPVVGRWLLLPRGPSEGIDLFGSTDKLACGMGFKRGHCDFFRHSFRNLEIQRQVWIWNISSVD